MTSPTIPALRGVAYFARVYRRTWKASVATTFANPVLYLLAMGVGLGSFINHRSHPGALGHLSYLRFVAPALAAATAAETGAAESLFPVMGAIKWTRTYYAMLATPLSVGDVLAAQLCWICVRITMTVAAYLMVMTAFGAATSYQAIAILPVGLLTGAAFAIPLAAYSATQESETSFPLIFRFLVIPLFLFSGVFFPISQLPEALHYLAYMTPLWHGVALCRALAEGKAAAIGTVGHLAYLLGLSAAGLVAARYTFRRRLLV